MAEHETDRGEKQIHGRRPYRKPSLKEYGRLSGLTQGAFSKGTDGADGGMMNQASDRRLKTNVVRVGRHPLGVGLYLFDYRTELHGWLPHGRQFGVMADEVAAVFPEAVRVDARGYQTVDYGRLRIERAV